MLMGRDVGVMTIKLCPLRGHYCQFTASQPSTAL